VGKGTPRCDACDRRIRKTHHELRLTDPLTSQIIGCYHSRPGCQEVATKYLPSGTVLSATVVHPDRCGPNQSLCDAGLSERGPPN
jgi:hypothetical protein